MADDSDLEKTEQPSARRLEQARSEGQVPQSRELSTFLVLLAGVAGLWGMGGWMSARILGMLREGFHIERVKLVDQNKMLDGVLALFMDTLVTMTPFFAILIVSAIAAPILMGGFVFAPNVLGFKFERMDPVQGFARMFSLHGVAELVKSLMKTGIVGVVGAYAVWREREHIFTLMGEAIESAVPDFLHTVLMSALLIIMGLAILALIDVPFQLWQYNKRLRMTKEEVKREAKEQEGDPHVKARIRGMQREMARRRMMAQVPKADVVVTNPTHFSVALKYDAQKMRAPIVVAKGRGELALKIRELAKEHKVPLLEAPPLARALYKHCDLEQAVPGALYTAVAEVMAYVYQLNHWLAKGGLPPAVPAKLPVPEDMDPGSPD